MSGPLSRNQIAALAFVAAFGGHGASEMEMPEALRTEMEELVYEGYLSVTLQTSDRSSLSRRHYWISDHGRAVLRKAVR